MSDGTITNSKGIPDKKIGKYWRCMEYDGSSTCNHEFLHKFKTNNHICSNANRIENQKKIEDLTKIQETNVYNQEREKAYHLLLTLISSCNLPMNCASSSSFWEFIYYCMSCYKNDNSLQNAKDFFPTPSRQDISIKIAESGKNIILHKLEQFSKHFGSVILDGYTKRRRKVKAFMLIFPQFDGIHIPIKIAEIGNTQVEFSLTGAEVIDFIESKNVKISTINSDGYGLKEFVFNFLLFLSFSMWCI
jgi:hypothetical protein